MRLGLPRLRPHTRSLWTEEERAVLKELFVHSEWEILLEKLPRHTRAAIRAEAQGLGLNRTKACLARKTLDKDMGELSNTTVAYLAGLIDGEGHVSITLDRRRFHLMPVLGIANTDLRIVEFVEAHLPVVTCAEIPPQRASPVRSRRPVHRMHLTGVAVGQVMFRISPYMTAKRNRAELLIEFCEIMKTSRMNTSRYTERQIELFLAIRQENSRRGDGWRQSEEYRHLIEYLISRQAPGISWRMGS